VSTDELLDALLIPRANGSAGLERVAAFLAERLAQSGATVSFHEFVATPHGFALAWTAALLLMGGYVAAIAGRRYALALALVAATAALLLLEFEALRSPVSGLLPARERNVVGSFPARAGAPTLLFSAHYDTTTHFGDHFDWRRFGFLQGPATAAAVALAVAGLARRRRGRALPRRVALPVALACATPFAAMFWCQSAGPLLRTPSVGAIDNGGSVAALLRLAERLASRPADAPVAVELVFFAAEEERALGSLAFARSRDPSLPLFAINVESVGSSDALALVVSDGFALRRYRSPPELVDFVSGTARALGGEELPLRPMLAGTLTDGRSFLASGIPAVTLLGFAPDGLPRNLHSWRDSRDRLSPAAIERCAELLAALVERADASPQQVAELGRRAPAPAQRER
jgi:acetylornithine deacetylase/succinyl-diaminopimelate desuccinylase-like protein